MEICKINQKIVFETIFKHYICNKSVLKRRNIIEFSNNFAFYTKLNIQLFKDLEYRTE